MSGWFAVPGVERVVRAVLASDSVAIDLIVVDQSEGRETRERLAAIADDRVGPDAYRTLVVERGWSREQWAAWAERSILTELFEPGRH